MSYISCNLMWLRPREREGSKMLGAFVDCTILYNFFSPDIIFFWQFFSNIVLTCLSFTFARYWQISKQSSCIFFSPHKDFPKALMFSKLFTSRMSKSNHLILQTRNYIPDPQETNVKNQRWKQLQNVVARAMTSINAVEIK